MIEIKVKKTLGEFHLDAELHAEGFICLSGRNGAGKSTLLNIVSGILMQDEGFLKLGSEDISRMPMEKRGVVLVTPQSYLPHMQVEKHLLWGASIRGYKPNQDYVKKIKDALGISYSGKVQKLSLGMRERVSLATALLSRPSLILIDETFSNIDNRTQFISSFRNLCSESKIDVIFTTQFPEDSKLADHTYMIERGRTSKIS